MKILMDVVLEAIANHLPVLCFDTCGQGDAVNECVGRKVPLSNPNQSVKDFAKEIDLSIEKSKEIIREKRIFSKEIIFYKINLNDKTNDKAERYL